MARISKYAALTAWLQEHNKDTVHLSFDELNDIITLPNSAYVDRPAWANCTTVNATSFQRGWLDAGYKVSAISLTQQWVEFTKADIPVQRSTPRETPVVSVAPSGVNAEQLRAILQCGYDCYNSVSSDVNHRYLSWEHCHTVFKENRHNPSEATVDYMCLHLAWYLASWGMLRNSFLMQKDYKVHKAVVELICQPQWDTLWDMPAEMMVQERYAKQVVQLSQLITDAYIHEGGNPTETLLTKILLGTIGCVPAYDRYFRKALAVTCAASQTLNVRSIVALGKLYTEHADEFAALQRYCSERMEYPAAKVLDMCFFEYGLQLEGVSEE